VAALECGCESGNKKRAKPASIYKKKPISAECKKPTPLSPESGRVGDRDRDLCELAGIGEATAYNPMRKKRRHVSADSNQNDSMPCQAGIEYRP
jgi:hypothetical protein